jgi:hypothetical protein
MDNHLRSTKGGEYEEYPNVTTKNRNIVKVLVYEGDNEIRNITVNIYRTNKREWLYNIIMWATLNHKSIEIVHIDDYLKGN